MKNLFKQIGFLLLIVLGMSACRNDDDSSISITPQEAIKGTWIGVLYPETDTLIIDEQAEFIGRFNLGLVDYEVTEVDIRFYNDEINFSKTSTIDPFSDTMYIADLITIGYVAERGILYNKID